MKKNIDDIQAVFVLGSPRSGTTVINRFIGTSDSLVDMDELSAIYFSKHVAEREYRRVPTDYKGGYINNIQSDAVNYMHRVCQEQGKGGFVEGTPWNLRVIPKIEEQFPGAVYVMNVRHYAGVIQSMRKSYAKGYGWAGPEDTDRAKLWAEMNGYIDRLPPERTIFFSYDAFCQDPETEISKLEGALQEKGIQGPFDRSILAVDHASNKSRPAAAFCSANGATQLHAIEPFDQTGWTRADEGNVHRLISPACQKIAQVSGIEIEPVHKDFLEKRALRMRQYQKSTMKRMSLRWPACTV